MLVVRRFENNKARYSMTIIRNNIRRKKCGAIRRNKAAKDDNMDLLIDLSSKQV